jgi:hypothetical protein
MRCTVLRTLPGNRSRSLSAYLKPIQDFVGDTRGGVRLLNGAIENRVVSVIVPPGITAAQEDGFWRAYQKLAASGVQLRIVVVP